MRPKNAEMLLLDTQCHVSWFDGGMSETERLEYDKYETMQVLNSGCLIPFSRNYDGDVAVPHNLSAGPCRFPWTLPGFVTTHFSKS